MRDRRARCNGYARERALGGLKASLPVAWRVAMCLLADDRDGNWLRAPHGEVEGEPAHYRDHDVQHFRRHG